MKEQSEKMSKLEVVKMFAEMFLLFTIVEEVYRHGFGALSTKEIVHTSTLLMTLGKDFRSVHFQHIVSKLTFWR